MIPAQLVVLLVVLVVFTPTWVVLWQMWTARLSVSRRSLPPRPARRAVVPAPRQPTA